jgi:hypothetical protein
MGKSRKPRDAREAQLLGTVKLIGAPLTRKARAQRSALKERQRMADIAVDLGKDSKRAAIVGGTEQRQPAMHTEAGLHRATQECVGVAEFDRSDRYSPARHADQHIVEIVCDVFRFEAGAQARPGRLIAMDEQIEIEPVGQRIAAGDKALTAGIDHREIARGFG